MDFIRAMNTRPIQWFLGAILCFAVHTALWCAENEQPLLGDVSDGSRAVPVHLIPLLDEEGIEITPADDLPVPFSTRQTCALKCHSYETVMEGWHFNALREDASPGRPGHPWIYTSAKTGTVLPLSLRSWPGTYRPEAVGLSSWEFLLRFARQMPGGGIGESSHPDRVMRSMVSGKLEANCLACHDADPAHDQAEYAAQIARENFRWAAAATSAFASVEGSANSMPDTFDYLMPEDLNDPALVPPAITYRAAAFDHKNRVFFDIQKKIPNQRCYFCHSSHWIDVAANPDWIHEEDAHLAAGLLCVDCHRNGLDHNIVRGYEGESQTSGNPLADVLTCKGCHLGDTDSGQPVAGRLAAPVPRHKGIPIIHFEKLSCTACHSGPWPSRKTELVKTSIAHGLGLHNVYKSPDALPRIISPVFARQPGGAIAPHNLLWPSFWGVKTDSQISPLPLAYTASLASVTSEAALLSLLETVAIPDTPGTLVYVTGGLVYERTENGSLRSYAHSVAQPYLWPIGHNVRPAAQSLGIRGCEDCHATDAPFLFGQVAIDRSMEGQPAATTQIAFQRSDPTVTWLFAASFVLRPWFKTIMVGCVILLLLLLWAYGGKWLLRVTARFAGNSDLSGK